MSGNDSNDPDVKLVLLLRDAGKEAVQVYYPAMNKRKTLKYEPVIKQFAIYTTPLKNIIVERFIFNNKKQQESEPFNAFVTGLKKLIKSCEFGDQSNSVVRDTIVLEVTDINLLERMLREIDLSLSKAISIGKSSGINQDCPKNPNCSGSKCR